MLFYLPAYPLALNDSGSSYMHYPISTCPQTENHYSINSKSKISSKFYQLRSPKSWLWMLLLSHFSRVRLCATPQTAANQAPPSLGFSRQEHWSGLPFPFPMHESEKWKGSRSVVSDSSRPHGPQPTRLFCSWDFPGKSTGVACHLLLQGLDNLLQIAKYFCTLSISQGDTFSV